MTIQLRYLNIVNTFLHCQSKATAALCSEFALDLFKTLFGKFRHKAEFEYRSATVTILDDVFTADKERLQTFVQSQSTESLKANYYLTFALTLTLAKLFAYCQNGNIFRKMI